MNNDRTYFLAVDIGASSGRLILSWLEDGRIRMEEIHRFPNGMKKSGGHLVWDTDRLFEEILDGMKKCGDTGRIPVSVGVDTWAVDFVLLDSEDQRLGEAVGYRDPRTGGMDALVYGKISEAELYKRTGIQKQPFNTIYQLMAVRTLQPGLFAEAKTMLMIPDYLNWLLCGCKAGEYTNATTTQLVSPLTKDWDYELIDILGYGRELFQTIRLPGERLGRLRPEIAERVGFDCEVVLPATHDTGSAVMAVPCAAGDVLYISSGTWSLMGTELAEARCDERSRSCNFTNEGGYDHRFRYLKNIMGMWMINSARAELAPDMPFNEICELASRETIPSIVSANDPRFLAPDSMVSEVREACRETGQPVPEGMAQVAAVIYNSLAQCYADTAREIEEMTGRCFDTVHIIGGGANADYLNRLTAKACRKKVLAGPTEATALGNIAAQMIAAGELKDLQDARSCICRSSEIREYSERSHYVS